jgi:hypothetical protein
MAVATTSSTTEVLDAAVLVLDLTATSRRAGRADATDFAARQAAMGVVLAVADHVESSAGSSLSSADASIISSLRCTFRRYARRFWQTTPMVLRNR